MRTADMIKSKFWRAKDVEGQPPLVLTISDVSEELMGRGAHQEVKCYLWFRDHAKGLGLNRTRVAVLEAAYGPDSALWVGKRVRISYDPAIEFAGKLVGGVRVETQTGVRYTPPISGAAWGAPPTAPPGAPPPPVWDEKRQAWITAAPPAAAAPARPPPPVWNPATQQWDTVDTHTGEMLPPPPVHRPPPTISERVAAGSDRDQGWGNQPPAAGAPEFDDDIPF